jgi:hypothetical protein
MNSNLTDSNILLNGAVFIDSAAEPVSLAA